MNADKTTLRGALKSNDLESFIKDHEADPAGDLDKVEAVIQSTIQESGSLAPKTSSKASSDD